MLSTVLMAQATPTENEYATNTSGDELTPTTSPTDITTENGLALEDVKDVLTPQSTIATIVLLVDGLTLGCLGGIFPWSKQFMASFTAGIIGAYIGFIAIVPFGSGEADGVKKVVCITISTVLGLLAGILFIRYQISDAVMASAIGGFMGVITILELAPDTSIANTAGLIAFRIFLFMFLVIMFALSIYGRGPRVTFLLKAFSGAFLIILGIDFFAKTGFTTLLEAALDFNLDAVSSSSTEITIMGLATVVLGASFWLVKLKYNPRIQW
jgi:hypothetical protein